MSVLLGPQPSERAASDQEEMVREVVFRDPLSIEHAGLKAFLACWNAARGARSMPERRDIDPKTFRGLLNHIHLYEVVGAGANFLCRVAGARVYVSYNVNMRDKLITEHPHVGIRGRILMMLRRTAELAEPVYALSLAPAVHASRHERIDTLWLPLGRDGRVDHVIALTFHLKV